MTRPPPRFTRTDTVFPYTPLFRSGLVLWLQQISGHMRLGGNRLVQRLIAAARIGAHQDQVAILVVERGRPLQRARRRHMLAGRSEEHTSELQSLMRISYAVFCLKKKKYN